MAEEFELTSKLIEGVLLDTKLRDKFGEKICLGDWVEITQGTEPSNIGCVWRGQVCFEEGVVTIAEEGVVQVRNPDSWRQVHDWIRSRSFVTIMGMSIEGRAAWRRSLPQIANSDKRIGVYMGQLNNVSILRGHLK